MYEMLSFVVVFGEPGLDNLKLRQQSVVRSKRAGKKTYTPNADTASLNSKP